MVPCLVSLTTYQNAFNIANAQEIALIINIIIIIIVKNYQH